MSMFDAMRGLRDKFGGKDESPIAPPKVKTVLEEMQGLVLTATYEGQIDKHSGTWLAVSRWAANELLQTFARQEGADDDKAAALRARAKVLRELLAMETPLKEVKFRND